MTTKKTAVLAVRVPMDVYLKVRYYSAKRGLSVSDWIKPIILRAITPGKLLKK